MDETALAFEHPHARASATHAGPPLDRISVRDYVRGIEIGAFRSERGVTQRLRFNVVLEVAHRAAGDDDVDRVVSYDTITDAIEAAIAPQRLNLLETLAERIAAGCLADTRAVRVFVRVEKLDRIPGSLGVEIVRSRVGADTPRLRPMPAPERAPDPARPIVLLLSCEQARSPAWREAVAGRHGPVVVVVAAPLASPIGGEPGRQIGLLGLDQAAWALVGADPRFEAVASRTELDWATRTGRRPVWAPWRMLEAETDAAIPGPDDPAGLAAWLAREIGAAALAIAGPARVVAGVPVVRLPEDGPARLAEVG